MNLKQLSAKMHGYSKLIRTNTVKKKRVISLAISSDVTLATPVDEGRARSNWQASVSSPITETIDAYFPGEKGSTAAVNAQAAIDQQQSAVNQAKVEESIFITNNLPYIIPLNRGHSPLAEPGYIERSVERGIQTGRRVRLLNDD